MHSGISLGYPSPSPRRETHKFFIIPIFPNHRSLNFDIRLTDAVRDSNRACIASLISLCVCQKPRTAYFAFSFAQVESYYNSIIIGLYTGCGTLGTPWTAPDIFALFLLHIFQFRCGCSIVQFFFFPPFFLFQFS